MSVTVLSPPSVPQSKTIRVEITNGTVIGSTSGGKTIGVPVAAGSVIDVSEYDAATLFDCVKAERAEPGAVINVIKSSEPERKTK